MNNKKIYFERTEDVKLTYATSLYESDWNDFKEWAADDPYAWEVIKDMTFEDALDIITNHKEVSWSTKYFCDSDYYTQYFSDYLADYLRDIAIDRGAIDEDYYDDGGDERTIVVE